MLRPIRRQLPGHVTASRFRASGKTEEDSQEQQQDEPLNKETIPPPTRTAYKPPRKLLRAAQMDGISHKYVPDNQLHDAPARLFREILKKMSMNPRKWAAYLRDYLDYVVTTEDPNRAKIERVTRQGNIKDTYFQKHTLTFNKLLEGLSILRMQSCKITIAVVDENGEVFEVSENIRVVGSTRLNKPLVEEETPSKE